MLEPQNVPQKIPLRKRIDDVVKHMYRIGISPFKQVNIKESKRHKYFRYFLALLYATVTSRNILLASLYINMNQDQINNWERMFICLGDNAFYYPLIRTHWNLMVALISFICFMLQILHLKLSRRDDYMSFKWLQILRVLDGNLDVSEIGLSNKGDIDKLAKM